MKVNVGKVDKVIRVILGVALLVWGAMSKNWIGIIGVIPLVTGIIGQCPLYRLAGINTCNSEKVEK
ncbi:MAG: YgaP family membrane protein [Fusobacteriota bacterium]